MGLSPDAPANAVVGVTVQTRSVHPTVGTPLSYDRPTLRPVRRNLAPHPASGRSGMVLGRQICVKLSFDLAHRYAHRRQTTWVAPWAPKVVDPTDGGRDSGWAP